MDYGVQPSGAGRAASGTPATVAAQDYERIYLHDWQSSDRSGPFVCAAIHEICNSFKRSDQLTSTGGFNA